MCISSRNSVWFGVFLKRKTFKEKCILRIFCIKEINYLFCFKVIFNVQFQFKPCLVFPAKKCFYSCMLKIDYHDYFYDNHDHDCVYASGRCIMTWISICIYSTWKLNIKETHSSVGSLVPLQFFYFLSFPNMSGDEKRRIQNGIGGILIKNKVFLDWACMHTYLCIYTYTEAH